MSKLGIICFLLGVIIGLLVAIIKQIICHTPTIEIDSVVRCKDCKWRGSIGCAITIVDESDKPTDDDFCAWGERE